MSNTLQTGNGNAPCGHTSWRLCHTFKRHGDWQSDIFAGRGATHEIIAIVVQGGTRGQTEAESNARLIAAAPELLAALEAMLFADNAICENIGTKSDQTMQRIAAIDCAQAAIAKARGTP